MNRVDEGSALAFLFEQLDPEIFAELDVYWALVGGEDPVRVVSELGGKVYDLIEVQGKGGVIAKDSDVTKLIGEIRELEEQLKAKEEEIEEIKAEKMQEESSSENNSNEE